MNVALRSFLRDENGTTAIEYAIIASMVSIVIFVAVGGLGENVNTLFQKAVDAFPKN